MPNIGLLRLTVSENRVGLYMPILDALGRPDGIIIHRGVKVNEGKLIVEAADFDTENPHVGVIPIDYERKKIEFYSREFVDACKDLIRKYGGGEFSKGIFFTVKGARETETTVMFDFHVVVSRVVSTVLKPKKRAGNGRISGKRSSSSTSRSDGQADHGKPMKAYSSAAVQSQAFSGFSMPTAGRTF